MIDLPRNHVEKIKRYWESLAKSSVTVSYHLGVYHGLCNEDAAKKLMHVYRFNATKASIKEVGDGTWNFQLITNLEKSFGPV